ncbi:hypothetical protein [Scytonema sp. NUACC26]|uniref:hypothetical protein n=1 Tax=Scytonema sp. NUACC26 TaxID=3140176 RepID=UPI0038B32034
MVSVRVCSRCQRDWLSPRQRRSHAVDRRVYRIYPTLVMGESENLHLTPVGAIALNCPFSNICSTAVIHQKSRKSK